MAYMTSNTCTDIEPILDLSRTQIATSIIITFVSTKSNGSGKIEVSAVSIKKRSSIILSSKIYVTDRHNTT